MNEFKIIFFLIVYLQGWMYIFSFVTKTMDIQFFEHWNFALYIVALGFSDSVFKRQRVFLICVGRIAVYLALNSNDEAALNNTKLEFRILILFLEFQYFTMLSLFTYRPAWEVQFVTDWKAATVIILAELYGFACLFNLNLASQCGVFFLLNAFILISYTIYYAFREDQMANGNDGNNGNNRNDGNDGRRVIGPLIREHLRWMTTMSRLTLDFMDLNLNNN